jgi:hypothetical protein
MLLDAYIGSRYPISMAKEIPSVGDPRRKSEVTDDEIDAATAAYLKDENAEPFVFQSGHQVDVAKAIEMHPRPRRCWLRGPPHPACDARW